LVECGERSLLFCAALQQQTHVMHLMVGVHEPLITPGRMSVARQHDGIIVINRLQHSGGHRRITRPVGQRERGAVQAKRQRRARNIFDKQDILHEYCLSYWERIVPDLNRKACEFRFATGSQIPPGFASL
jgi:hypothetical protein